MKSRSSKRKRIRKRFWAQCVFPAVIFAVLLFPGLFLPHYFLDHAEHDIYGNYTVAREEIISPYGSNADFLDEVKECLELETGYTRIYTLTASDLTREEILKKADTIHLDYLKLPEYPLESAYVYGDYYKLGLWQMEWLSEDNIRSFLSLEARTGMLFTAECQREDLLNQEELMRFLDYYIDWQIYFPDQPSREESRDGFSEKIWLSNQNIGFAVTQIQNLNGFWDISLQLFYSAN